MQYDDLTDGVLSLRVQNEFVLEWVKANFLPTIIDKIRESTGWSVQVCWTIDQHLQRPITNVPPSPPVRPRAIAVRPSTTPPVSTEVAPRAPSAVTNVPRKASFPDDLNTKHTFGTFVVGPSNQLAHAAAVAAAGGAGRRYNPLFICGGTGLGKTHLVHAIAHRVLDERPSARIIYVSAERFTNDFISAIQHHRMDDFRARYRVNCDVLLVDDIQFLAGREQTQEEFFTRLMRCMDSIDRSWSPATSTRRTSNGWKSDSFHAFPGVS